MTATLIYSSEYGSDRSRNSLLSETHSEPGLIRCDDTFNGKHVDTKKTTTENIPSTISVMDQPLDLVQKLQTCSLTDDNKTPSNPATIRMASSSLRPPRRRSSLKRVSLTDDCSDDSSKEDGSNKSVSFLTTTEVKPTISHIDMTEEEKEKTWMQEHESRSIRNHCKKIIDKVEHYGTNVLKNGKRLCTRGLEGHFRARSQKKKWNRFLAADEVFSEQEEQFESGYYDDEAIAYVYSSVTSDCQLQALETAAQDRKDVEHYLFEDDLEEQNDNITPKNHTTSKAA